MLPEPASLDAVFAAITEPWSPVVVAELNGQQVKAAKLRGEFQWHAHAREDELFLVRRGTLEMHFRDRVVTLGEGELLVVPAGVEHKPVAPEEVEVLLFEPATTVREGDDLLACRGDLVTGGAVGEEDIAAAEEALGVRIEGGYRRFLQRRGWAEFGSERVAGLGGPIYVDIIHLTRSERDDMEPALEDWLLPLRNDGFGNLDCLDLRTGPEPAVVFRRQDLPGAEPERIAESFDAWLADLLAETPED